jgi:hypothetical protein
VCRISITQQVKASNINIHLDNPTFLTEEDHKAVVQQVAARTTAPTPKPAWTTQSPLTHHSAIHRCGVC